MFTFDPITTSATRLQALKVYQANSEYFRLIGDDQPTLVTILNDAKEVPIGKTKTSKHFRLIKQGQAVIGVCDWITGYPTEHGVYLGLLLISKPHTGLGQAVMAQLFAQWQQEHYSEVELGVVTTNVDALAFWTQLGFKETRRSPFQFQNGHVAEVVVMQRQL
ncbi:N-acetyltransferase family protein [Lacticaseibacillus sp. N501-2]|uniref:GNAT family N-acetyltransferase n=1 Tax=Lacticaseibacillus salsurae TaxID=3367729 RepID=UPI0038B262BD